MTSTRHDSGAGHTFSSLNAIASSFIRGALSFSVIVTLAPFFFLPSLDKAVELSETERAEKALFSTHSIHPLIRYPLEFVILMIVGLACLIAFESWVKGPKRQYSYLLNLVLLSFTLSFEVKEIAPYFWTMAAIYALVRVGFSSDVRRCLVAAFRLDSTPPVVEFRLKVLMSAGATAIITSILIILKFRDVYTICVALVSCLIVTDLIKLNLALQGKKSTLNYHLADSVAEFLAVCTSAVATCCLAAIVISHFLPGWLTVHNFVTAKDRLQTARDVVKNLKLNTGQSIGYLLCLWLLRFLMLRTRKLNVQHLLDKTSVAIKRTNKIVGYVYLACVAAASFTLANAAVGAPMDAANDRIESLLSIQARSQSRMFWYLQAQYKERLFDNTWNSLTHDTQSALNGSERMLADDWEVFRHYQANVDAYGLDHKDMPPEFETFPEEIKFRSAASFELSTTPSLSASLTLNQLETADEQSLELETQIKEAEMPVSLRGMGKDLAHKIFDATLPLENLWGLGEGHPKQEKFIEHIGYQYPLVQEMLSSVVGGVQDYTFDKIWALAGEVISRSAKNSTLSLKASAEQSIEELLAKRIPQTQKMQRPIGAMIPVIEEKSARITEMDQLAKKQLLERIDDKRQILRDLDPVKDSLYRLQHSTDTMQYQSGQASQDVLNALLKVDKSETSRLKEMLPLSPGPLRQHILELMGVTPNHNAPKFDVIPSIHGDLPDATEHPSETVDPAGK